MSDKQKKMSFDPMDQQRILHNPFDIEKHKNNFINYLEVVILEDGTIEYAVPSHQTKLLNIFMSKYKLSHEDAINSLSVDSYFDELLEKTNCVSVWNTFYMGEPNENQLKSLIKLKNAGLFQGFIQHC